MSRSSHVARRYHRPLRQAGGTPLRGWARTLATLPRDARLYVGAEVLAAFATGAFGAVYNLYVLALGFAPSFLGTLLVAGMLGAGAAVVPAGALVDRLGARALLLGGSLVVAAGVGVQLALPLGAVLLAGNALAGAGAAAFYVAAAPYLARVAPEGRQNELFSLDTAAALGGTALGSVVAGQVATLLGAGTTGPAGGPDGAAPYRLSLLLGSAVGALSFPLLLATRATGAPAPAGAGGAAASPARDERAGGVWRAVLTDPVALRLAAIGGLIGLGAGLFLPYLNVYFVQQLGASPAVYGWISGVSTLTRLGATLLAPAVAGRLGTVGAIAGTQLASVPFLLLLGFAPQLGLAALAFLIRGALMNMAFPLQTSFTMGALRPALRGTGNALLILAGNVSRAASTLAGGALIERSGYRLPYLLTAAIYTLGTLLFWLWFGSGAGGERDREGARRGTGPHDPAAE
ncbi:MAG TPA: MFS transporter [Chloroflexota bacterium]|nr:MFS transporter [Chloroflexota bacterium]